MCMYIEIYVLISVHYQIYVQEFPFDQCESVTYTIVYIAITYAMVELYAFHNFCDGSKLARQLFRT